MHKSTTTTFVLLASTLVMLSAMPLFNNNNAAMAQGYDNNYYGDSNRYSQYPTDDKKYECRTGPLEGFFVSSVEFCKHVKFDDDKNRKDHDRDSRTGPPAGSGNNNSTLVNTFNCINNNNININTDNNSSSSSGLQPIQDAIAQGLNGTLDELSLNKTIINLCFINDNDNIVIEDAGNGTNGNGNETDPCEDCFAQNLNATEFAAFEAALAAGITIGGIPEEVNSFDELCDLIDTNPRSINAILEQVLLEAGLFSDIGEATFFEIVDCIATALNIEPPPR